MKEIVKSKKTTTKPMLVFLMLLVLLSTLFLSNVVIGAGADFSALNSGNQSAIGSEITIYLSELLATGHTPKNIKLYCVNDKKAFKGNSEGKATLKVVHYVKIEADGVSVDGGAKQTSGHLFKFGQGLAYLLNEDQDATYPNTRQASIWLYCNSTGGGLGLEAGGKTKLVGSEIHVDLDTSATGSSEYIFKDLSLYKKAMDIYNGTDTTMKYEAEFFILTTKDRVNNQPLLYKKNAQSKINNEKHDVMVQVWVDKNDGNGSNEDMSKRIVKNNVPKGDKVQAVRGSNNVELKVAGSSVSNKTIPNDWEIDTSKYSPDHASWGEYSGTNPTAPLPGEGSYNFSEKEVKDKNIVFRVYYKVKEKPPVLNKVRVFHVKQGTGTGYENPDSQIAAPIYIPGEYPAGSTQVYGPVAPTVTYNSKQYEFTSMATFYSPNPSSHTKVSADETICPVVYTYTVSSTKDEFTDIVIEYKEIVEPEKPRIGKWSDERLGMEAKGHILSDFVHNRTHKDGRRYNFNVLNGIPSSERLFSYAESAAYIFKAKGNWYKGKHDYNIQYIIAEYDPSATVVNGQAYGLWVVKAVNWETLKRDYDFSTITDYDICKLSELYIQNELLTNEDGRAGLNEWTAHALDIEYISEYDVRGDEKDKSMDDFKDASKETEFEEIYRWHERAPVPEVEDYEIGKLGEVESANSELVALYNAPIEAQNVVIRAQNASIRAHNAAVMLTPGWSSADLIDEIDELDYVEVPDEDIYDWIDWDSDVKTLAVWNDLGAGINARTKVDYKIAIATDKLEIKDPEKTSDNIGYIKDPNHAFNARSIDAAGLLAPVAEEIYEAAETAKTWWQRVVEWVDENIVQPIVEGVEKIWEKLFGSSEVLTELGDEIDRTYADLVLRESEINSQTTDVFKEKFYQDCNGQGQLIDPATQNGLYRTTESYVMYTRFDYLGNYFIPAEYYSPNKKSMSGVRSLTDSSSYESNKYEALSDPYNKDLVNDVYVHTPVSITIDTENATVDRTQYLGGTTCSNVVEVGRNYRLVFDFTKGQRGILGYGNRDYRGYIQGYVVGNGHNGLTENPGNAYVYIKFPYDIEVSTDNGTTFNWYMADKWYVIGVDKVDQVILHIPDWAEEELNEGIVTYQVKVNALNDNEYTTAVNELRALNKFEEEDNADELWKHLGWEVANNNKEVSETQPPTYLYRDVPYDYRSHYNMDSFAVGKVYDFRVDFTLDPEYLLTYTSGRMKDGQSGNAADGFSIKNLPLGRKGTNPANPSYTKAPKLGNKFKFNLKTLGWKTNNIAISAPKFYFIPKTGTVSDIKEVDVYYQALDTGKYVKLDSSTPKLYKISTTLPATTVKVPNTNQTVTEPGPNASRIEYTNSVKNAYSDYNQVLKLKLEFDSYDYERVHKTSPIKYDIGNLKALSLAEKQRYRNTSSTIINKYNGSNIKELASNSVWYGEYKLPSTSVFVNKGSGFSTDNKFKKTGLPTDKNIVGDGYILVCFNIKGKYSNWDYVSYQKSYDHSQAPAYAPSTGSQWEVEGFNTNITLPNNVGTQIPGQPTGNDAGYVGVMLYEAFEDNGEDQVHTN